MVGTSLEIWGKFHEIDLTIPEAFRGTEIGFDGQNNSDGVDYCDNVHGRGECEAGDYDVTIKW